MGRRREGPEVSSSTAAVGEHPARRRRAPFHVMHVVTNLGVDGRTGGMEYGVIKLANSLDRRVLRTSVVSSYEPDPAITRLLADDVSCFHCARRPGNDVRWAARLWSLFRRERPDVVHTHSWGTLVEGYLAARLARVSCVVHGEHGTMHGRRYQLAVQRWVWNRVDCVMAVSSRLADRLSAEVGHPRDRIRVVRNGLDLGRFTPDRRAVGRGRLGLADDELAIGTVGRLVEVKDHANLVDALARVRGAGVRFRAFIAGDGPCRIDVEGRIRSLGLEDCTSVLGHRSDPESVLAALDIFVQSSKSEGLSNTVQEALGCGVSVVATAVGGTDELVSDGLNGLLVPPCDSEALAGAILTLARDPNRRELIGRENRLRAEREFGLETMLRGYVELYLEFLGRGANDCLARDTEGGATAPSKSVP